MSADFKAAKDYCQHGPSHTESEWRDVQNLRAAYLELRELAKAVIDGDVNSSFQSIRALRKALED